ncbi:MAG: hypothetical protein H6Q89_2759 [Myxococcaceae bacterium]|nr:hypothetical protein [Myxococcaceae bacterium]
MSEANDVMLRLAGITHLTMSPKVGPKDAFVFEPHRLALPAWAWAMRQTPRPAVLVTFDRHLDLAAPKVLPPPGADVLALDSYARRQLDVRNVDHILAAMEAGLISDAVVIARSRPEGCVGGDRWVDSRGTTHLLLIAPSLDRLINSPRAVDAANLISQAGATLLDFDLDCFTTLCDADPLSVVPWPIELIREQVLPSGSKELWDSVLGKCAGLTFARESAHCGGLVAGDRLFADAAQVIFKELLAVDLP